MAISSLPQRDRRRVEANDPILEKLADSNTFESDWEALRHHLHVALLSTLPVFLSMGPPRPYRPPQSPIVVGPEPIKFESTSEAELEQDRESRGNATSRSDGDEDKLPAESLLLSPSAPTSIASSSTPGESTTRPTLTPRSVDAEPTATPSASRLESLQSADDLLPSTPGGLVIPPFPPLDPNRKRRSSSVDSASSASSNSGPSTITLAPNPRMNGFRHQPRVISVNANVVDDDYDEEVVIGGKTLPSWMPEDEGKKELERVAKILDELESPPYTIQRLAELLLQPTQYHTSIGKFLRAVEKTLLVNTPWEPPSYVPTPHVFIGTARTAVGGSSTSASSDNGYDTDSTMPPGSTTPLFSPIPFLNNDHSDSDLGLSVNDGMSNGQQRSLDDGLMSPLMLNDGDGTFGSASNPRSPTPEPEDAEAEGQSRNGDNDGDTEMRDEEADQEAVTSPTRADIPPRPSAAQGQYEPLETAKGEVTNEHHDPAHQSYLGRVDELDTGPIPTTPTSASTSDSSPSRKHGNGDREELVTTPVQGTGEGGNMTPHGMSEKPVPISSTTVVKEEKERHLAGLPRSTSEKSLRDRFVSAGAGAEGEKGHSKSASPEEPVASKEEAGGVSAEKAESGV